jgi:hypothetical protein
VDHLCVDDLLSGAVTFRLALEVTGAPARKEIGPPALVPAQRV